MRTLTLLLVAFSLASCRSAKITTQETITVRDTTTTVVTVTPRDTLIKIPGDAVKFRVLLADLTEKKLSKKSPSGRTEASVFVMDEELFVDCKTDSLEQVIQLQEKTITTLRNRLEQKDTVVEVPVKFVPWYIKTLAWIGGALLLLGACYIAIMILKPKIKL